MQFDDYNNRAAGIAAGLVNLHIDGPPELPEVRGLLDDHDVPLRIGPSDLDDVASLAAALRPVFEAADAFAAVAHLNPLLAETRMAPHVSLHDGRPPHLHMDPPDSTDVERLRANCLMGLAAVLCDGGRMRLGPCDADACDHVYVDTSRNARRRYCSDRCATRTHVAAHRARRASA